MPPGSSSAAMPDDADVVAISPQLRTVSAISVMKVLPKPAGPSRKLEVGDWPGIGCSPLSPSCRRARRQPASQGAALDIFQGWPLFFYYLTQFYGKNKGQAFEVSQLLLGYTIAIMSAHEPSLHSPWPYSKCSEFAQNRVAWSCHSALVFKRKKNQYKSTSATSASPPTGSVQHKMAKWLE